MIQEITQFIMNRSIIAPMPALATGTDLWMGHRPQDCADACDVILESTGGMVYFDLPERADPVIQVLSRDTTYLTARTRAWNIYDAIFREHTVPDVLGLTYGSAGWRLPLVAVDQYEAMIIEPLAPPQYIGTDEKLRHEFSCNYIFKIKKL